MRAAIYIRVSTEEQALRGYSLDDQLEACVARARAKGATSWEVFADEGHTGTTLHRPGLEKFRDAVRAGAFDLVVIRDPDRFARKLSLQLLLTEEIEKAGAQLDFVDFTWQDTPEGRLFYSIRGAIAEYEVEKIRERMARGKRQKAKAGGVPVNLDCYGYTYDPETGEVHIKEDEAAVVRDMFTWFATEDIGVLGVAKRLTAAGVPTRRGARQWWRQVVHQILSNPIYKGEWHYGKVDWRTRTPRDPKDVIIIPVPAIVDADLFERVQAKLRQARRLYANRGRRQYLLSGITRCGDCGAPMCGIYAKWWHVWERRYTCRRPAGANGFEGCKPVKMVIADDLEKLVWEQVCAVVADPDALARRAAADCPQIDQIKAELKRIETRLAETNKGREALLDALSAGVVDLDDSVKARLVDLKKRKERLEAKQRELEAVLCSTSAHGTPLNELRAIAADVINRLDELEFEERRALVRAIVSEITITGRPKRRLEGVSINITLRAFSAATTGIINS